MYGENNWLYFYQGPLMDTRCEYKGRIHSFMDTKPRFNQPF